MEYKVESSLERFEAWSCGKDTLDVLIEKGDCDEVEQLIEEMETLGTDTAINDFLWFERDAIAEHLGYKDWDAYEEGWSLEDLEEAQEWWDGLHYCEKSEISGISGADTDDDDAQFEEGQRIDEWWEALDDAKAVEVYYNNN